jgi:hypothetical protein
MKGFLQIVIVLILLAVAAPAQSEGEKIVEQILKLEAA